MATTLNAITSAGGGFAVTGDASGVLEFQSAGTTYMTLNASGNVGIGISSPSYKLDVAGQIASQDAYLITANSSGTPSAGAFIFRPASNTIALGTASTERMRISSSGYVGIGTTTVGYPLDIRSSGGANGIHLSNNGTQDTGAYINATGNAEVMFSGGANYNSYSAPNFVMTAKDTVASGVYCRGDAISFWVNTGLTPGATFNQTTRMIIDSSGNVGIGTSSPSSFTAGAAKVFVVNDTSSSTIAIGVNNSVALYGKSDTGGTVFGEARVLPLLFLTSNTERMRIDTSGNVLVTGAGGLGYGTGSGGTVTQATSRTTAVTINKYTGQISTFGPAAGSTTPTTFTVNNSVVTVNDVILLTLAGNSVNIYNYSVQGTAAGSFKISFWTTGGTTSESVVFNFVVIKTALS